MTPDKRIEFYSSVINDILTRLRFAILRSTLAALRRFNVKKSGDEKNDLSDVDFNSIPGISSYEA